MTASSTKSLAPPPTASVATARAPATERAKTLPKRLQRVFVGLAQVRSDVSIAEHLHVSRQRVATWRDPDAGVTPNLRHIAQLPDDACDHVLQELARLREEDGHAPRQWVELTAEDRAREQAAADAVAQLADVLAGFNRVVELMRRKGAR